MLRNRAYPTAFKLTASLAIAEEVQLPIFLPYYEPAFSRRQPLRNLEKTR